MPTTKLSLPVPGLYFDSNGLYTTAISDSDTVIDFARGGEFGKRYLGQSLAVYSVTTRERKEAKAVQLAGGFLKMIPYVKPLGEAIEWGGKVYEFLQPSELDPIITALAEVDAELRRIRDENLAAWVSAREASLADLRGTAAAALQTTASFLNLRGTREDPVWAPRIANAYSESKRAVESLAGDIDSGHWMRPDSLGAISWAGDPTDWRRGWMPHIPDRAAQDAYRRVWDYRWALPALTYAIAVRVFVLRTFSQGSAREENEIKAELRRYVKLLEQVFRKRWEGIRTLNRLNDAQWNTYATSARVPLVAVDLYGGDFQAGVYEYPWRYQEHLPFGFSVESASLRPHPVHTREGVDHNVGIFARHWWNLLFLRTGGEDLLLYISELQMHANPPASAGQRSFADVVEHMRDLQVRDATLAVTLSDLVAGESDGADVRLTRMAAIAAALEAGTQNTESLVRDFAGSLARTGESLRYYRRPQ
jgi:hypothetical protein